MAIRVTNMTVNISANC